MKASSDTWELKPLITATIRPARADDAATAAPLILSAGPDAFNYVFSHRTRLNAETFIGRAFGCDRGEFSWQVHWVAEVNGHIVGTAAGYTGETARHFLWPAVAQILRCFGAAGGARVIWRGLETQKIIVPPARPDLFYIGNVAVLPALRGRGIGQQLMAFMHEEGRRQRAAVCALDVSAANSRAEALYTRLGYRVVGEQVSNLVNPAGRVASHRRMELDLLVHAR